MRFAARAADSMEEWARESRSLLLRSQCANAKSGLGFTSHWLLTGLFLQSPHAWSKLREPLPTQGQGTNLTASPRSSNPPTRLGST